MRRLQRQRRRQARGQRCVLDQVDSIVSLGCSSTCPYIRLTTPFEQNHAGPGAGGASRQALDRYGGRSTCLGWHGDMYDHCRSEPPWLLSTHPIQHDEVAVWDFERRALVSRFTIQELREQQLELERIQQVRSHASSGYHSSVFNSTF